MHCYSVATFYLFFTFTGIFKSNLQEKLKSNMQEKMRYEDKRLHKGLQQYKTVSW